MKLRSLASSFLLCAAVGGCADSEAPVITLPDTAPVVDLPARTTNVSGVVYDPEAFLIAFMTLPEEVTEEAIPGVFNGPYTALSAIMGGSVTLSSPEGSKFAAAPSDFGGTWQLVGVPSGDAATYLASATPPEEGVVLDPEFPIPLPPTTYFPTTYVRPILASVTQCYGQSAVLVGNTGALDAVAQAMTAAGTPTTPADLLDSTKTGGVALLWVHDMSFLADLFQTPVGSIAEASAGQLFALDWAPPEGLPGQSPMGFSVLPGSESFLGYFALVLPPNSTAPVTINLIDTFVPEPGEPDPDAPPRPYLLPSVIVEPRPGEVSVYRAFGQFPLPPPGEEPPPGGGLEDPPPPEPETTWACYIPPEPVEPPAEPVGPPAE
ncbi:MULTISPECIES: hypothetical protein [unclassified Myxococcus]|uniref:hypothetical protein n=1 Tax=unclassified Myxococcus TaxID=2648731 RepID=UPI0020C5CB64|nr:MULTISPECIES: hypothetical protein [unclassified Myxococcus]